MSEYIKKGPVADSVPYDNEDCDLKAETTQEAIDELCTRQNAPNLVKINCDDLLPSGCTPIATKITRLVNQNLCNMTRIKC